MQTRFLQISLAKAYTRERLSDNILKSDRIDSSEIKKEFSSTN